MSTVNVDIELLKENLKQKGYKLTPQRRAILDIIIEKEINEEIEYPLCIKAKSGAYPEDCGGTHMDMKNIVQVIMKDFIVI